MLPHYVKNIKQCQGDAQRHAYKYIQYKERVQAKPDANRCCAVFDDQRAHDERKGGGDGDSEKECGYKGHHNNQDQSFYDCPAELKQVMGDSSGLHISDRSIVKGG